MKPSPLKGKRQVSVNNIDMFDGPDIRAAVKWLELHLMHYTPDHNKPTFHNLLHEAFEDVMK